MYDIADRVALRTDRFNWSLEMLISIKREKQATEPGGQTGMEFEPRPH